VGFFKDLRKLNKMGREQYMQMDVNAQMQQASAAMAQAQQMMGQQVAAASMAAAGDGERASATITAVQGTGALINYQPVVEVSLLVQREGQPPYPATVTDQITVENRMICTPGHEVQVIVDRQNPATVSIDWVASASPG
jgi:hypothetical protein